MFITLILCVLVCSSTANYIPEVKQKEYCSETYECTQKIINSICEYKCKLASECRNYKGYELSDEERQYVLDIHNFYRNFVAEGNETRGGHSSAANMMVMNYEKRHEDVLHCWMRRCVFAVDKCRSIKNSKRNGQNIYQLMEMDIWNPHFEDGFVLINRSIALWYSEVKNTNANIIEEWPEYPPPRTANASQILWAQTVGVACGFARMHLGNIPHLMTWRIYCNYNPGIVHNKGAGMYIRGAPASKCPNPHLRNTEYTNLCGKLKIVYKKRETFAAYINNRYYEHTISDTRSASFWDQITTVIRSSKSIATSRTKTTQYSLANVVLISRLIVYIMND